MKKLLIIVSVLSFFLFIVKANERKELMLDGIVIVLDAGHGGKDQGASCSEGSEAEINLAVVKLLKQRLSEFGANVVLTRDGDHDLASEKASNRKQEDLKNRMKIIQDSDADLFISIHANSFGSSSVRGIQLFYQSNNDISMQLCKMIHAKLQDVNEDILADKEGDYYVLKESKVPSILVECGFLSNPQDRDLLFQKQYQEKLANRISEGILEYFVYFY